jgi:hypothetical protein
MPAVARLISTYNAPERCKSNTPALPDVPMIRSMEDLLAALRTRRDELQITHETIDDVAGWPSGYAGKLLALEPIKNLGWVSFGLALDSMGVALVMIDNAEQRKLVEKRWVRRERPRNAAPAAGGRPMLTDAMHRRKNLLLARNPNQSRSSASPTCGTGRIKPLADSK